MTRVPPISSVGSSTTAVQVHGHRHRAADPRAGAERDVRRCRGSSRPRGRSRSASRARWCPRRARRGWSPARPPPRAWPAAARPPGPPPRSAARRATVRTCSPLARPIPASDATTRRPSPEIGAMKPSPHGRLPNAPGSPSGRRRRRWPARPLRSKVKSEPRGQVKCALSWRRSAARATASERRLSSAKSARHQPREQVLGDAAAASRRARRRRSPPCARCVWESDSVRRRDEDVGRRPARPRPRAAAPAPSTWRGSIMRQHRVRAGARRPPRATASPMRARAGVDDHDDLLARGHPQALLGRPRLDGQLELAPSRRVSSARAVVQAHINRSLRLISDANHLHHRPRSPPAAGRRPARAAAAPAGRRGAQPDPERRAGARSTATGR